MPCIHQREQALVVLSHPVEWSSPFSYTGHVSLPRIVHAPQVIFSIVPGRAGSIYWARGENNLIQHVSVMSVVVYTVFSFDLFT
jgi:2-hydroxychromene-2-carboxylate isomerase